MRQLNKLINSPLVVKSGIAFFDQAMLSAVNFLITIILIKSVPKVEYGYFSIAFSVSLFLISIQNAVITTPFTVLLPTKNKEERSGYSSSLLFGQLIFLIPVILLGLIICGILYFSGWDKTKILVISSLTIASFGLLFREFLRAYYFAHEEPQKVIKIDLLYVVVYLSLIAITYFVLKLNVAAVIFLGGMSALIVSLIFNHFRKINSVQQTILKSYKENWIYGKWALAGVLVTHIQNYSYLYILAAMLGSLAVADVSASRLLLMPFLLVQVGWSKIALPHGARLQEAKRLKRFFKEQIVASILIAIVIIIYVSVLFFVSEPLKNILFTEKYNRALDFIFLWGIVFIGRVIVTNASIGLQVIKDFHIITKANLVTMVFTVSLTFFLIKYMGARGGLLSLIIGDLFLATILWLIFFKRTFENNSKKELPKELVFSSAE